MSARILDGVPLADAIRAEVAEAAKRYTSKGRQPGLAVVIVGENPASQVYMKAKGKGVIGMKILGAGKLRNRVDESLQFALAQDCVDCFTIGAENQTEQKQLIQKIPAASVRA